MATVMKVFDSRSAATGLRFPKLDIPGIATLINPKYKEAVAVMTLTDQSATGDAVDVAFDNDRNGKLTWDIGASGGTEWKAITDAFPGGGQKVVIVRDMVSVYLLAAAAAKDATTITINATATSNFLAPNSTYPLGTGATRENITVQERVRGYRNADWETRE